MITNLNTVIETFRQHTGEFAEVKNPAYIYPPVEYYPLAQPIKRVEQIKAVLMDMDGTTTTTEVLCIYSLEMMIRRMSGRLAKPEWEGIDHTADLAHIIGNSTTKHVEYLANKYQDLLQSKHIATEYILAARWTLLHGRDEQRKAEVFQNLKKLQIAEIIPAIQKKTDENFLVKNWAPKINKPDFNTIVSLGIDIYYETYHRILAMLREGKIAEVRRQVFGDGDFSGQLISPMPGIPVLIPLMKGWFGNEAGKMADILAKDYEKSTGKFLNAKDKSGLANILHDLGSRFEKQPVKLGLVTSSIFYEADIVIREVLSVMAEIISQSNLSNSKKQFILEAYKDYHHVYDAFVTASDSNEIRLKPHRDLYSIALHKAGIMPEDFNQVIGFEDSQSGTIAIRAAGIGCCVAVPFAQTLSHNLEAAAHVLPGGVPQAILDYRLFLKEDGI